MSFGRRFQDDEPKECDACGDTIFAGSSYQYIKKCGVVYRCCSKEDCMSKLLFDLYEGEFREIYLKTAEDHENIYGDMEYNRRKDERHG